MATQDIPRLAIASDHTFKLTLTRQSGHTYDLGEAVVKIAVALHPEGEAIACISTQDGLIKDEDLSSEDVFVGSFVLPAALSADFTGITQVYLFPRVQPMDTVEELTDFDSLQKVVFMPAPRC